MAGCIGSVVLVGFWNLCDEGHYLQTICLKEGVSDSVPLWIWQVFLFL